MKNVQEIDPRSSIDNFLKKRSLEQKIVIKELGESQPCKSNKLCPLSLTFEEQC